MKETAAVLWIGAIVAGFGAWQAIYMPDGVPEFLYAIAGFECGLAYAWWRQDRWRKRLLEDERRAERFNRALMDKDNFGGWRNVR